MYIMHIEYPPNKSVSDIVKKLKGRTSRKLQMEFKELSKRYWGKHFWSIWDGVWSTGDVTQDMVDEYLEHHRTPSNRDSKSHINGIESFWSYAKIRFVKFRGVNKKNFNLHLKECEFRFNHRGEDLYKILLEIFRKEPLKLS